MKYIWQGFWTWYERNYKINIVAAAVIFLLQLLHLYWLFAHVILLKLTGSSFLTFDPIIQIAIVFVDYLEIPTIFGVSLIYINELRKGFSWKPVLLLLLLNSQWLHIFWITDEFIVSTFADSSLAVWPVWLYWSAIAIDYLELPVMYDTAKRAINEYIS